MIDKNFKPSDLSVAKKIAQKWISNPVIDINGDGVNTVKVKSIYVINKTFAVYLNSDLETITDEAERNKATVTVVMENGVVLEETEYPYIPEDVVNETAKIVEEKPAKKSKKK
jgi:uncharacterized NAD(P)/FAD-binding protein YdhS